MNDKQLSLFLTVADEGSFSKAEQKAFISKQAMLRQINALEAEVGVPLLLRTSEGVTLTDAGREFYKGAEKMLRLRNTILTKCRSLVPQASVIRVGQVEHQALLDEVNDLFAVKYPDIQIKRVVHPNHSGEYRVSHGIIDVGETFFNPLTATSPFAYTKLADMPYLAAMRHSHPLAQQKTVSLRDLTDYSVIVYDRMVKKEYMAELEDVFASHPERILHQDDPDNQVSTAFLCQENDTVFLTANCFVRHIPELAVRALDNGWFQEYGIIYPKTPSELIRKYIDLAISVYQEQ